jgi:hypothetical protein
MPQLHFTASKMTPSICNVWAFAFGRAIANNHAVEAVSERIFVVQPISQLAGRYSILQNVPGQQINDRCTRRGQYVSGPSMTLISLEADDIGQPTSSVSALDRRKFGIRCLCREARNCFRENAVVDGRLAISSRLAKSVE